MRAPSLRVVLVLTTVVLVGIAVVTVGGRAVALLRHFADEQAVARVGLALEVARGHLESSGRDLFTTVRILSERPSLARLLDERDAEGLHDFLERFRATGGLDGCAASAPDGRGAAVAVSVGELPWEAIAREADRGEDGWFLVRRAPGSPLLLAAASKMEGRAGGRVAAARELGSGYAADLADRAGVPVAIVDPETVLSQAPDAVGSLLARVATTGTTVVTRVDDAGAFVAACPLRDRAGAVVGLLEARLETAPVDASVGELVRGLAVTTSAVAVLAALTSLLLARRIVQPLAALTRASARIGRGDLTSPMPRIEGGEAGTLAEAMEEMRDRLLRLTRELGRRRAEAEAVLHGISEGVFAVNRERKVTYLNPQAAAMLGTSVEQAVGRFCGDVLNPSGPDGKRPCDDHCPILDARFRGDTRATESLVLPDGSRRTVIVRSAPPVAEPAGGVEGALFQFQVLRDETEEEAVRSLRDDVLAHVSHEFRTPLSAQLASLEMIRERLHHLDAADVDELVQSVERAALRLTALIDNLLESLRIQSGVDSIRSAPVRLDEVMEEAVEATAPLIRQKGQRLDVDLPHPLPEVCGDSPRLAQVFVNLLANANKFAGPGTTISVGGDVGEAEVTLWVKDEGPGLPDDEAERLFERFLRHGRAPEAGGMGLGLWIVRSIVERHGGRARARNTDKGARFDVVLPVARTP
jgi:signal transduction histidine kinase